MGTYTDTILLENQERLEDIENILYSDSSDSTFVKVLKHKLEKCSTWFHECMYRVWYSLILSRICSIYLVGQHTGCLRVIVSSISASLQKEITQHDAINRKPMYEELISLRRKLALLAQKPTGYTAAEVNEIQEKVS